MIGVIGNGVWVLKVFGFLVEDLVGFDVDEKIVCIVD